MKLLLPAFALAVLGWMPGSALASSTFDSTVLRGCYESGGQFYVGNEVVDIDEECCTANDALYNVNDGDLKIQLDACADSVENDMLANTYNYCNSDLSMCTLDYEDIECDDEVMATCQQYGGKLVQANLEVFCEAYWGPLIVKILNKVDCTAAVCQDEDVWEVYQASMPAMPYDMKCAVMNIDSVRIDGRSTSFTKGEPIDTDGGTAQAKEAVLSTNSSDSVTTTNGGSATPLSSSNGSAVDDAAMKMPGGRIGALIGSVAAATFLFI